MEAEESTLVVTRGRGEGAVGSHGLMFMQFLFSEKKVLEVDSGDGCTTL